LCDGDDDGGVGGRRRGEVLWGVPGQNEGGKEIRKRREGGFLKGEKKCARVAQDRTKSVGSELAISSITKTGHNVPRVVEVAVEGSEEDLDVGVSLGDVCDSLRCSENGQNLDVGGTLLLETVDGGDDGTTSGEHGVEDEDEGDLRDEVLTELVVVVDGLEARLVTIEAEVPDARGGEDVKGAVHHAETSTEDRDEGDVEVRK